MEPRIAKLESDVEYIKRDIGEIKADVKTIHALDKQLAVLTERVSNLPTKGWSFVTLAALLGFFAAIVLFQDRLRDLLGLVPPTP